MRTTHAASVSARGLVKRFGELTAVDGIDLDARPGNCLGILGPNGAGKTTTIEMLEGITTPDAGTIEILGRTWRRHAREIRADIGVQLQETKLQEKLTVAETLRMFRSFYADGDTTASVMGKVGLLEKQNARLETLSGGQKQRLSLGCALINRPRVLFLDEPTTGLDPQARRRVWEIVEAFKQEGGTVLLTTHYMEEAERLADQLMIVDRGKVIAEGTPSAIIGSLEAEGIVHLRADEQALARLDLDALGSLPGVRTAERDGGQLVLSVTDTQVSLGALLAHLENASIALEDLRTHRPTLEDVFVHLTGKQLRDA